MRKLLLWLVMVAVMIAAILGGTAAFLYSRTGTDALPQEAVTFGEQTLEPNGWSWVIPVLGDKVNKTYESPTNLTVQKLGTFTDTVPQLVLPDWVTAAELQIAAPDGTVWTGALADCNTYTYTQNGDYQIIVTAHHSSADSPGDPVGWYAYRAGYTMAMNPKVTLSTERAPQGSIVAVQLSGILDGEPSLETDLGTVWFRKTASGYMGYIPVTYNAEGGDHTLHLTCGSLEKDITLTVTRTMYDTVTVPAEEDTGGGEEFRNAIWPLYTTGSSAKLWNGRFEAPSAGAVVMEYGVTQMVDSQRSGQATGLTYAAADGETVTAPQAGNVVFAGTLTLTGGTVVIDHGCGVKSYLYGLETVGVERGQSVSAGDPLGTAGTEPEPTADAPAADDTPAAEAPPEAAAADTAVTDTPEQTGDVPAEDAAEPSGLVFSDGLANDKALAAEAARMANISRTAQLSIAQIMAGLEENPAPSAGPAPSSAAPQHDSAADDEDDEPQDTIPQALGRGVFGMFKWLLLVVLFVLIIAGGGVAWLYRSATPDMLPEVKVTFDGQELAPTAYKWHVPVVGSFFRRTYAETLNSSPVVLEDAISDASPDIIVTPSDYSTQLTITDADKETVYEGSVTAFRSYLFAENGTFDAKLVVTASDSAAEDRSSVTGTETWQFRFTVSIKPSVTLCTPTVQQGSVAAVRVGSTMSRTEPTLTAPLESTGFVRAANGWICYLPIPWNAETGNTELTVTADGYTETLTLSVRAASYSYKDYSAKSQLMSPYIGADDAPDAVRRLLTTDGGEIQWAVGGFVQPFLDSFDTPLLYGMTEYVGRSYSERSTNYGYGGRTSTNVVIKPKKSKDSMIVPASGHVLLAEDLGGSYGYTVVIGHGAGLRSIFYGLTALDVEAGDDVKQGQLLGTSGRTVVAELRIGTVPINPLLVWRGQCDGLKYY